MSLKSLPSTDGSPAPAERADAATLRRQRASFLSDPVAVSMLEAMPGPAVVLNPQREILAVNSQVVRLLGTTTVESLVGQRVGEAAKCVNASRASGGCGTSDACAACGALRAILDALATRGRAEAECRILTRTETDGGARDFRVHASYITFGEHGLVVFGFTDISGEKRRRVLERVFFHDLLNTAGGLQGIAEMLVEDELEPSLERAAKQDLSRLSHEVVDEIEAHRELLAAERGELVARPESIDARRVVEEVAALYRRHPAGEGRTVAVSPGFEAPLHADPVLLRRVLGNLVKNALEATPADGVVTLACDCDAASVSLTVHNVGVMPVDVQRQLFQRSFSTKGGSGRGLGTYSVKLLGERHLDGHVTFTSSAGSGTTFLITLPREPLVH